MIRCIICWEYFRDSRAIRKHNRDYPHQSCHFTVKNAKTAEEKREAVLFWNPHLNY